MTAKTDHEQAERGFQEALDAAHGQDHFDLPKPWPTGVTCRACDATIKAHARAVLEARIYEHEIHCDTTNPCYRMKDLRRELAEMEGE